MSRRTRSKRLKMTETESASKEMDTTTNEEETKKEEKNKYESVTFPNGSNTGADRELYTLLDRINLKGIPKGTRAMDVWIPICPTDQHQQVMSFEVESPISLEIRHESEHGNAMLYGRLLNPEKENYDIFVKYRVVKNPTAIKYTDALAESGNDRSKELYIRHLQPEKHVRVVS